MATESYWGDQAMRLIRTKWPNSNLLAEELYAIFKSMFPPDGITDQVTFVQNGEEPVIRIITSDDPDNPPIQVQDPDGTIVPPATTTTTTTTTAPETESLYTPLTGVYPGVIVSGTGSSYTVTTFRSGLFGDPVNVQATQLQIDVSKTIPAGTYTPVFFTETAIRTPTRSAADVSRDYYIQVPVWLAPP